MRLEKSIHRMKPMIVSTEPRTCELKCSKIGRRQYLKNFLLVTGALIAEVMFTRSASAVGSNSGVLRINVSSLAALVPVGGSVLVTYDAGATQLLINRASAGNFYVLNPTCTHAGCTVDLYVAANQGISCPCHGSFFGISGQVLNGPANRPLASYQSSFDGDDTLSVTVPGLEFYIESVQLESPTAAGRRLKISFPTHSFASYSIQRTANLTDAPQTINFATTATGAANQTTLLGSGEPMSVWVDASGSSGFFTLSLQLYVLS
jgi:cytochrome b6-f complex iron-sulfur subunit